MYTRIATSHTDTQTHRHTDTHIHTHTYTHIHTHTHTNFSVRDLNTAIHSASLDKPYSRINPTGDDATSSFAEPENLEKFSNGLIWSIYVIDLIDRLIKSNSAKQIKIIYSYTHHNHFRKSPFKIDGRIQYI